MKLPGKVGNLQAEATDAGQAHLADQGDLELSEKHRKTKR
jgi:hypothetical protein